MLYGSRSDFLKSCVFLEEFGFDVNMDPSRGWPFHGSPAIVESPTAKAGLQTDIGGKKRQQEVKKCNRKATTFIISFLLQFFLLCIIKLSFMPVKVQIA
ncbi:hypothetical protein BDF20DRAFT_811207 [Mycotypha africana]|uniref:uncharacterized protein n=1 Tax=Mycotypha africana TaxID=64632 RepID=UPI0023004B99|nr:uncharacterized protein BDF20DRAFT_811207 [Mycotypha africana]KAI8991929.1 hypothetical protein BDF20DRAFT_811207 [Mycotypha africana]